MGLRYSGQTTRPVPKGHREGILTVRTRPLTARSLRSDRMVQVIITIPKKIPPGRRLNPAIAERSDIFVNQPVIAVSGICFPAPRFR